MPSGRKIVISGGETKYFAADGKQLVEKYFEQQEGKIDIKPSGRYSVTKNGKTRYFAANGTEINESYFKQVENPDVTVQVDGKTYNLNKTIEKRMSNVTSGLKKAEGENGYIGASWSWAKNTIGFGDSSDKVRELQSSEQDLLTQFNSNPARRAEIFKQLTEVDYTSENLVKFIKGEIKLKSELALAGYKEGQEMAVDVTADVVTGIVTAPIASITVAGIVGAPETGGLSLVASAVGVTSGAVSGAIIKPLIKWSDAKSGGREYTTLQRDAATGAVSGALGALTFGTGSAVRNTVTATGERFIAKFVGKEVVTEAAKQTTKQTVAKGAVAFTAKSTEYSVSGAMFGAGDTAFRTAYDGGSAEEIFDSALEGGAYGAGGGFIFGHAANAVAKGYSAVKGAFSDDVVPIQTPKRTRAKLKETIASGQKVTQNTDIKISKGRLRGPGANFAETDDAFRDIIRLHPKEFRELSKKSGDDFMNSAFKLIKKYMGLEDAPIEFKITDNINYNHLDEDNCYIAISRNWTGKGHVSGKGDPAEIVGAIAHELNHMLQNKEGYINAVNKDIDLGILNSKFMSWLLENDDYFVNHSDFYDKKADAYIENWKHYIEPEDDFDAYLKQTIEAESHPRGNIVVEEYKKLLGN